MVQRTALLSGVLLAVGLAACGASTLTVASSRPVKRARKPTMVALLGTGHVLASDLDDGNSRGVCFALTGHERGVLARRSVEVERALAVSGEARRLLGAVAGKVGPITGCKGFVELAVALARAQSPPAKLGTQFDMRLSAWSPEILISGDTATYLGAVLAHFEGGRWRFEEQGREPPFAVPVLKQHGRRVFPPE